MVKMDDAQLVSQIELLERQALGVYNTDVAAEQATAMNYYLGRPFGTEEEGRSQVISSDVWDVVEGLTPLVLKPFVSSDDIVRFSPEGPEDEDAAEQESDYINWVVTQKNDVFDTLVAWVKTGLLQKNGIVKYWWEKTKRTRIERYYGLPDDIYTALIADDDVKVLQHTENAPEPADPNAQPDDDETGPTHDVVLRVSEDHGEAKYCVVPPEEFLVSRDCTSPNPKNAKFVQHRTRKTLSELREMGYDVDDSINDYASDDPQYSQQFQARNVEDSVNRIGDETLDPSLREVVFRECYMLVDSDGDGIAELRKVCLVGRDILANEETEEIPFCAWTPYQQPFKFYGKCPADESTEIQLIKSTVLRQTMDNIYTINNNRQYVSNKVNIDDLLDNQIGGTIRVDGDVVGNHVMPAQVTPIGAITMPMIEYFDSAKENRTGFTRYNQGTDASSLNKMLDIHTVVPMADGTKKLLRDVDDGDRIIGRSGLPVVVTKAHEIHEPKRAYRMVFASGEEIVAGGEHLWTVMTPCDRNLGKERVVDTDWIARRRLEFQESIYIPRVQRPEFSEASLPLDPYILGYWLGDGHGWSPRFTTMDAEIVERWKRWAIDSGNEIIVDKHQNAGQATTYYVKGSFYQTLRDADLMRRDPGTDDYEVIGKHIPSAYLRGSYAQRLELLRGLMDSDGCHHSGALVILSQKAGRLCDDAFRLIESLGGWPSLADVNPGAGVGKPDQDYHNITFHLFDNPFWLSRKADKWRAPRKNVETQSLVGMEEVPTRLMRCLTVDAEDGLFCVGNRFTVTHNTATGVRIIAEAGNERVGLISRSFAELGLKPLMLGIHGLCRRYGDKAEIVRLRGKYVTVDPRGWKTRYDMSVSVGLGTADQQMKMQGAQLILNEQKQLVQAGIVKPVNLFNAAAKLAESVGEKNPEKYFTAPDEQPPQPPDPMQNPEFMLKVKESKQKDRELDQNDQEIAIKQQTADQQGQLVAMQVLNSQVANVTQYANLEKELANHSREVQAADAQDQQQAQEQTTNADALQQLLKAHQENTAAHQEAMSKMNQSHEMIAKALAAKNSPMKAMRQPDGSVIMTPVQ